MGMSSSQARLLHLTARMHQIEHRAQKIQADKLRLANESDRVYNDYLEALDATKIQYKSIANDGSTTFRDATLAILENGAVPSWTGEASNRTFLIQNASNNELYLTEEFAKEYGFTDGETIKDPGDLDQWLKDHGCTQEPIMKTVTNYNDVQYVNAIDNKIVRDPDLNHFVPTPNTYSVDPTGLTAPVPHDIPSTENLSGSYNPAAVNGYKVENSMPTISVTPYKEVGNMKNVVTGGTGATNSVSQIGESHNSVINKTIYTLPANKTYNKFVSQEWNFTTDEVNSKLSYLLPTLNYDDDGVIVNNVIITTYANHISFYYDKSDFNNYLSNGTWSGGFTYDKNTTLKEFLEYFGNNSNGFVNYNGSTKLSSTTGTFHTISSDDAYIDKNFTEWFFNHQTINKSSETYTWNLDTNIQEYYNAIANPEYGSSSGHISASVSLKEDLSGSSYLDTNYKGSQDPKTLTYRQYFEDLKTNIPGFDYNVTSDGKLQLIMNGNYQIGFTNMSGTTTKIGETTNTYEIQVNTAVIAQNIYLGRCILAEKTRAEYNSGIGAVETIERDLNSIYGSDLKSLALLGNELEAAIQSNNKTSIQTVMTKIENMLSSNTKYTPSSTDYEYSEVTDANGNKTITKYNFTKTSSKDSFKLSEKPIPDGTTSINKGEIKNAPSDQDIKEYFAKEMYNSNNSSTYEEYLSKLNGFSLSNYELAILYNNQSNLSLINALINSTDKSGVVSWINSNLDKEYHTDKLNSTYYDITNQSTANNYSCTPKVNSPSRDDIIKYLAQQMFDQYTGEKSQTEWESYIKNLFNNSWNYTDLNVASISYNFESNKNDILNKLHSSNKLDAYINSFNGYDLNMNPSQLSFVTGSVEDHYVTCDNLDDIATRLAADMYASEPTKNLNDVVAQIKRTFNDFELASISNHYNNSSEWNDICNKLKSDMSTLSIKSYIDDFSSYWRVEQDSTQTLGVTVNDKNGYIDPIKGLLTIPTIEGIASNLVVGFRQAGFTVEEADIVDALQRIYGTNNDANNEKLANINHAVYNYLMNSGSSQSEMTNIYNNLFNGGSLSVSNIYTSTAYDISRGDLGRCTATYGTTPVQVGEKWKEDDTYKQAMEDYNARKQLAGRKIVIVNSTLANSNEFVNNYIALNEGFLIEFNPETRDMEDTSVAVNTALRQVSDEKDLKKAEAQYEADMNRINKKDTKYDTELAICENERNALKEEVDSLKTVIKDNVDRTFKLFS